MANPVSSDRIGCRFLHHWFRRETVTRALKVASVVGPTLTAINHYDVLLSLDFSPRLLTKILLTSWYPIVSLLLFARATWRARTDPPVSIPETNPNEHVWSSLGCLPTRFWKGKLERSFHKNRSLTIHWRPGARKKLVPHWRVRPCP